MNNFFAKVLTDGLNKGYAGGKPESVNRAGFEGDKSHIELEDGAIYHDEWFVETRLGGGQELVQTGEGKFTRLYAGGTPEEKVLTDLGITIKDVGKFLKEKILELGDKTRLFENCTPCADGDWEYSYVVTGQHDDIEITTGIESITYKRAVVHVHTFMLCSIR